MRLPCDKPDRGEKSDVGGQPITPRQAGGFSPCISRILITRQYHCCIRRPASERAIIIFTCHQPVHCCDFVLCALCFDATDGASVIEIIIEKRCGGLNNALKQSSCRKQMRSDGNHLLAQTGGFCGVHVPEAEEVPWTWRWVAGSAGD